MSLETTLSALIDKLLNSRHFSGGTIRKLTKEELSACDEANISEDRRHDFVEQAYQDIDSKLEQLIVETIKERLELVRPGDITSAEWRKAFHSIAEQVDNH